MYRCARCEDFLIDHTCHNCNLRHQCTREKCECHNFPDLPFAIGNVSLGHTGNNWGGKDQVHSNRKKSHYYVNNKGNEFDTDIHHFKNRKAIESTRLDRIIRESKL